MHTNMLIIYIRETTTTKLMRSQLMSHKDRVCDAKNAMFRIVSYCI